MGPAQTITAVLEKENDSFIVSYIFLRRAIGVIGILLPFVLVLGNWLIYKQNILQPSISDYYYTDMRNVLVGSLCAIGMFLLAYRGRKRIDSILGTFAFFFALGVAFFPTTRLVVIPPECPLSPECMKRLGCSIQDPAIIGNLHVAFAGALFITLAIFSIFLFTRYDKPGRPTEKKKTRNMIYRACGIIILVSVVLIALAWVFKVPEEYHSTYWLEAVAIVAFGVSWLIKGETLFADDKPDEEKKVAG